uniref:Uncharacterized protein n=1 Tax=Arundo donax TaxID=35708 RepID=A0A0A9AAF6_ARUDO
MIHQPTNFKVPIGTIQIKYYKSVMQQSKFFLLKKQISQKNCNR